MNLFVIGLRRSGTTILYDALGQDADLSCFYEPLRENSETIGGGSGVTDIDVFAETRDAAGTVFEPRTTPGFRSTCSTGAARERPRSSSTPTSPRTSAGSWRACSTTHPMW